LLSVSTSPSTVTGTPTASISDNGNPTLRWERTTTTNLGIDYSLLKGRIYGSIDAYNSIGTDITGLVTLAAATGTTSQKFNDAGITNRGVEISIGYRGQIGHTGIGYNSLFNFAYNYNVVNNLYFPNKLANTMLTPASTYVEGKPLNPVYSFVYQGMVNGQPTIQGPNGTSYQLSNINYLSTVGAAFMQYQGTATPPYTVSWRPSLSYKSFSLTALFTGTFGGVYRNQTFNYQTAYIGFNKTSVNSYVSNVFAGDPNIPAFPLANAADLYKYEAAYLNTLVESSSYIQCKDVMLDYTLPKSMLRRTQLKNVRFYLEGSNLGLIWAANKEGYDPDWLPGTERPLAFYTVGVNVGF